MKKYVFVAIATLGLGAISHEAKTDSNTVITSQLREEWPSIQRSLQELEFLLDIYVANEEHFSKEAQTDINIVIKKHTQLSALCKKLKHAIEHNYDDKEVQSDLKKVLQLFYEITTITNTICL